MSETLYADVIVDISVEKLDKPFQYRVPERLRGQVEPGTRVQIPFGRGDRLIKGYVVSVGTECTFDPARTKELAGLAAADGGAEEKLVALAAWMKRNYGSTMIQALKTVLPARKSVKKLEYRFVQICASREELISLLGESRRKHQSARARLLEALLKQESGQAVPYRLLAAKWNLSASVFNALERAGVIRVLHSESYRNPVRLGENADGGIPAPALSAEQSRIVDTVLGDLDGGAPGTYLIHGITGSGKTAVYIELIAGVLSRGRQAIVLIPEIALTYQTLVRFYRRFGDRVSVMNSTLSAGEKYDQCQRAKNGEIDVIIGPRSALFTPFPIIGLIVIDEEHESSYKSESTPKYHARETAEEIARLHGAGLVLGSATPSLEAYWRARQGKYQLFTLTKRLTGGTLPTVYTVDLREELRCGNRSIFSRKLQTLLADRLQKGQQSMLFLNRRGYAGFVSCRSCGEVMKCPHCDVSLSEHRDGTLQCHYCGYTIRKPQLCPKCGSKYLLGFKAGTQQIEDKLRELFPNVRTLRMDADTTRPKDSYEEILTAFAEHEADVLIGTQMIVKGHDFPLVTLVGVLAADLSLSGGDYRCGERTFQLLTQAVGRAGRGELPGEAVIQTYQPEHYAVVRAAAQDYEGFYQEEILYRELGGYPPVGHMLAVQIYARDEDFGKILAQRLSDVIKSIEGLRILGPTTASIGRISDVYRFVLYVKSSDYGRLVGAKDALEGRLEEWGNADPRILSGAQIQFDFDPMNRF